MNRFTELGGEISNARSVDPQASQADVPDLGDSDLVYLSLETAEDAVRWIPQIRQAGYEGPILGGDGYDASSVWAEHADIANVFFTTHVYLGADSSNPRVSAFLAAYSTAYPGDPVSAFAALGYDAVGLIATAH